MAAILNGFLPVRRKDGCIESKTLNTRWGDATISAPTQGGWSAAPAQHIKDMSSPEIDRDQPVTPPQRHEEHDAVSIVDDDRANLEEINDKDSITITIPLPWKKRKPQTKRITTELSGVRSKNVLPKQNVAVPRLSTNNVFDPMLQASTFTSPVESGVAASPVLCLRSRIASPIIGSALSPVAEGFARENIHARSATVTSPLQYSAMTLDTENPSSATGYHVRRTLPSGAEPEALRDTRRSPPMPSIEQVTTENARPLSLVGIGATAHMRASSREPPSATRGRRGDSIDLPNQRAPSLESMHRYQSFNDTSGRRTPSLGPVAGHPDEVAVASFNPYHDPSIAPGRRRDPSPIADTLPLCRRAPSLEPHTRRAPSIEPVPRRRAPSTDARGRRNASLEPGRTRTASEAAPLASHPYVPSRSASQQAPSSIDEQEQEGDMVDPDTPLAEARSNVLQEQTTPRKPFTNSRPQVFDNLYPSPLRSAHRIHHASTSIRLDTDIPRAITMQSAGPSLQHINRDEFVTAARTPRASSRPAIHSRGSSTSRTRGVYSEVQDDYRQVAMDVQNANAGSGPLTARKAQTPLTAIPPYATALGTKIATVAPPYDAERTSTLFPNTNDTDTFSPTTADCMQATTILVSAVGKDRQAAAKRAEKERNRRSAEQEQQKRLVKRWSDEYGAGDTSSVADTETVADTSEWVEKRDSAGDTDDQVVSQGVVVARRLSVSHDDCDADDESEVEMDSRVARKGSKKGMVPDGTELWS